MIGRTRDDAMGGRPLASLQDATHPDLTHQGFALRCAMSALRAYPSRP
jgi:hypothetical protein